MRVPGAVLPRAEHHRELSVHTNQGGQAQGLPSQCRPSGQGLLPTVDNRQPPCQPVRLGARAQEGLCPRWLSRFVRRRLVSECLVLGGGPGSPLPRLVEDKVVRVPGSSPGGLGLRCCQVPDPCVSSAVLASPLHPTVHAQLEELSYHP